MAFLVIERFRVSQKHQAQFIAQHRRFFKRRFAQCPGFTRIAYVDTKRSASDVVEVTMELESTNAYERFWREHPRLPNYYPISVELADHTSCEASSAITRDPNNDDERAT